MTYNVLQIKEVAEGDLGRSFISLLSALLGGVDSYRIILSKNHYFDHPPQHVRVRLSRGGKAARHALSHSPFLN
jgi:hypothetical protein